MSWSLEFDDPILLLDGKPLVTLRDAANHVMALPKTEIALPHWLTAITCLMAAAEKRGPTMLAHIAMLKALNHGQPAEPAEPPAPGRKVAKKYRIVR